MWLKGEFPTLLSIALSWSPDPDAILSRILSTSASGKALGMTDTTLDKMIVDARAILDRGKRADAYLEIQKRINDNAYVLDIYQYPLRWEMWWGNVKGYVPLAANIRSYVRTAWIDTVSYTHLDVYKRQASRCARASSAIGSASWRSIQCC